MIIDTKQIVRHITGIMLQQVEQAIEVQGQQIHLVKLEEFLRELPHHSFSFSMDSLRFKLAVNWPAVPQLSQLGQEEYLIGHSIDAGKPQRFLFNYRCEKGQMTTLVLNDNLEVIK